MGLSQFAFQLWEPGHPTETSRRRQVLPWTRKGEGWGIQCLATHWESFALRLGPLSQPCVAGSSGNVGSFSESCLLFPFFSPSHSGTGSAFKTKPGPRGSGPPGLQDAWCPLLYSPRACAQGEVGRLEVEMVRASPARARWPQGLPVTAGLAWPARKFCERCCGFLSLQQQ